jgi:hypothetical protein
MPRGRIAVTLLAPAVVGASLPGDDKPLKARPSLPDYYGKLSPREDQKQRILKLRADYQAKVDDLKRRIGQLQVEEKKALEAVLTPVQRKRLRQLRTGEKEPQKPRAADKARASCPWVQRGPW